MQARNIFRTLGTAATLVAASCIYSVSGDEKKPDTVTPEQNQTIDKTDKSKTIIREVHNSFNRVMDSLHSEKEENIPAGKLAILSYSTKLMTDMKRLDLNKDNIDLWLECANSLYKTNEQIISDSTDPKMLYEGWELLAMGLNPTLDRHEGNAHLTVFTNETLINFFDTLLKNSRALNEEDGKRFRETVYTSLGRSFCSRIDSPRNDLMLSKALDCITKNCVESKEGLEEIKNLVLLTRKRNLEHHNFNRAVVLGILDKNKDYIESQAKQICEEASEDFTSGKSERQIRNINKATDLYTWINDIKRFYFKVLPEHRLSNFISTHQLQNIEQLVGRVNLLTEKALLRHLSTVRVNVHITENSRNNIVDIEAANVTLHGLKTISQNSSQDFNSQLLETVTKRLETEINPYTRGILYQALAKIPDTTHDKQNRSVIDYLRDGVAKESFITSRHLGETLGEMGLGKLFEDTNNLTFYYTAGSSRSTNWLEKTSKDIWNTKNKLSNARYSTMHKIELPNIVKLIGSTNASVTSGQNFLSLANEVSDYVDHLHNKDYLLIPITRAASGHGDGVMYFLTDSLGYSNIRSDKDGQAIAENNNGETVSISKDINRIRRNAKATLLGYEKTIQNLLNSNALADITSSHDPTKSISSLLHNVSDEIITTFESTIYYNTFDSLPAHTATLIELYKLNQNSDLEQNINKLKENLFFGKTRLSVFEDYERTLLYNRTFSYVRDPDFYQTPLGQTWDYIGGLKHRNGLVVRNEELSNEEKYKRYKEQRKTLYHELEKLDSKLLTEEVSRPLMEAKVNFIKELFIDTEIPNREMEIYLDIAGHLLEESELNRILEQFENNYKMWAGDR